MFISSLPCVLTSRSCSPLSALSFSSTMPLPPKISDLVTALKLIPHPEGGFFTETFRSGSTPMSTQGQTGLDCTEPEKNLVVVPGGNRGANRPDGDERRNALTSIYWVPTIGSPMLLLAINESDHVHYYQGGKPFQYLLFDPKEGKFEEVVLGPDLDKGQKMQVSVKGGIWKCGRILEEKDGDCSDYRNYEYTLIGEAVAPGFDFHDFSWVTEKQVMDSCANSSQVDTFLKYVHESATDITLRKKTVDAAAEFYEENDIQQKRKAQRESTQKE